MKCPLAAAPHRNIMKIARQGANVKSWAVSEDPQPIGANGSRESVTSKLAAIAVN